MDQTEIVALGSYIEAVFPAPREEWHRGIEMVKNGHKWQAEIVLKEAGKLALSLDQF